MNNQQVSVVREMIRDRGGRRKTEARHASEVVPGTVELRRGRRAGTGVWQRASGVLRMRRGQTLVVALSVMFLLVFMGALFVAMIARNLQRVETTGSRTSAATLAESGLNWVNTQLTFSELGADWRPSPTWPAPLGAAAAEDRRRLDPDWFWLSDNGTYRRPWTRIASGDGRFVIRVDYEPAYHSTVENESIIFDPLSSYLHIQAVGRPGRIEDDPTLLNTPNNPNYRPGQITGPSHLLEAWKPIGLTDQLWWITNKNRERGPAVVGVPPVPDGQGRTVLYNQIFRGGLRSNMDVLFQGPTMFELHPRSGEAVHVVGDVRMGEVSEGSKTATVPVYVDLRGEAQNESLNPGGGAVLEGPSDSGRGFNPLIDPATGHGVFLDSLWLADNAVQPQRSIRYLEPPALDLSDTGSTDSRYRRMTRDTGVNLEIKENGATQVVNSGAYGYGDGIYIDNFGDIQYPNNRDGVMDEWLRRGPADIAQTGWTGSFYTPSVRESGTVHPILEVELLPEGLRMTRFDRDVRGNNLGAENQYKTRIFYQAVSKTNPNRPPAGPTDIDTTKGLVAAGPSVVMPYPANGVLYAEGSLRIKGGQIGRGPAATESAASGMQPVQLTIVSGGSIYIEGNLVKAHPASRLALLAHDNVCLNPTQFTAVHPFEDVTIEPDGAGSRSFHYAVPQNKDLDLTFSNGAPIRAEGMLLNLQQSAGFSDNSSNTSVSMYVNGLEPGNQYDFRAAAVKPPYPPAGGQALGNNPYLFQFFPPPAAPDWWLNSWGLTNFQSSPTSTVNYERKSFWIPRALLKTGAGEENRIRFHVEPTPDGQPWWLAGASLVPYHEPLQVEVDAVIYAQNGSWFVVPPPWSNDNPLDSRELYQVGDSRSGRATRERAYGTFPANTDEYPFYREPLNVQVTVKGAVTEGSPVDGATQGQWMRKLSLDFTDPVSGKGARELLSLPDYYQPTIRYIYDQDLRNWVRWRNVVDGSEGVAYTGPAGAGAPTGATRLEAIRTEAIRQGQNIVTLPILPRLPTSGTLFRGRPL